MNEMKWFDVDIMGISKFTTRKDVIKGVGTSVGLSPYDMPSSIGKDKNTVAIKYMGGDEPMMTEQMVFPAAPPTLLFLNDVISLEIGENSKRLYSITTILPITHLVLDESRLDSILNLLHNIPKTQRESYQNRIPYYAAIKIAIMEHVFEKKVGTDWCFGV